MKSPVPHRQIRQRVPGQGEEIKIHRGSEGAVQVAAAEGRRRAPAQEGNRDSGEDILIRHLTSTLSWISLQQQSTKFVVILCRSLSTCHSFQDLNMY